MNLYRILFYLIFIFNVTWLKAQNRFNQEIGLITENDLYVSKYLDQYYTNGLEIFYKKATSTKYARFDKKIKSFHLGQNIYNPYKSNVPDVYSQDRPYAGYLYARYAEQFINKKNLLTIGITTGLTGKKSGGEEAQNFIHKLYKFPLSQGWRTQVKQIINVGVDVDYTRYLFPKFSTRTQSFFISKATFSRVISNISSGFAFRLNVCDCSSSSSISNSSFFGTDLQTPSEQQIKEFYFGVKSFVTYQLKDLTVTGDLSYNPIQKKFHLQPWVWTTDIGAYWSLKRWNLSYHQIFYTKNTTKISKTWLRYGSIQISYKF